MSRNLPEEVHKLIRAVSSRIEPKAREAMLYQASTATALAEIPGCSIDLMCCGSVLVPLPDGPVSPVPTVMDDTGKPQGDLIIRIRAGLIVGVERPWYSGQTEGKWPEPSHLKFPRGVTTNPPRNPSAPVAA